jgi:hypothetical protein
MQKQSQDSPTLFVLAELSNDYAKDFQIALRADYRIGGIGGNKYESAFFVT